jgi:hypothetical protein
LGQSSPEKDSKTSLASSNMAASSSDLINFQNDELELKMLTENFCCSGFLTYPKTHPVDIKRQMLGFNPSLP